MSTKLEPLVSVVMPVYNAGPYLIDAVASIIEQTFCDWELICVNDGSTDDSRAVLEWFADQDERIHVINQSNCGIVDAINAGCAIARAPLICRMDCDDIALPDRLKQQTQYLQSHPSCMVVGGAILEIDEDGDPLGISHLPARHAEILENLLHRRTGHFHPTTMMRAEALEAVGGYRKKYEWVEDHDLWLRLARRGELANLPEPLLCYRQHAGSVCWQRSAQQRELMNDLLREAFAARGLPVPETALASDGSLRSAAGPGKWARLAARGGFAGSAWKHLKRLLSSDAALSYKARMMVECLLRIGASRTARLVQYRLGAPGNSGVTIPTFPQWHARIADGPARRAEAITRSSRRTDKRHRAA